MPYKPILFSLFSSLEKRATIHPLLSQKPRNYSGHLIPHILSITWHCSFNLSQISPLICLHWHSSCPSYHLLCHRQMQQTLTGPLHFSLKPQWSIENTNPMSGPPSPSCLTLFKLNTFFLGCRLRSFCRSGCCPPTSPAFPLLSVCPNPFPLEECYTVPLTMGPFHVLSLLWNIPSPPIHPWHFNSNVTSTGVFPPSCSTSGSFVLCKLS